jgi:hypothetical protein
MMKKSVLRLPKLKTRDELLRTAPELGRFLAAGDGEAAAATAAAAGALGHSPSPLKARPRSPAGKRPGSPRRLARKFSEDDTTEEDRVVGASSRLWLCAWAAWLCTALRCPLWPAAITRLPQLLLPTLHPI